MILSSATYKANYARSRQLGAREIFRRPNSATDVGPLGFRSTRAINEPRFSFDPVTLECQGILMEAASTNLLTYSNLPNGLSDLMFATNVTQGTMAGFPTAVVFPSGKTLSHADKAFEWVAGTRYCFSVFVEMDDGLPPVVQNNSLASPVNDFGLALFNSAPAQTPVITPMGNRQYRVSAWAIGPSTTPRPNNNFGVYRYVASTGRGFKVNGFQLEVGQACTSFIVTTATSATRGGSFIDVGETSFSKMLRQTEGTVAIRAITAANRGFSDTLLTLNGVNSRDYLVVQRTSSNDGVRPNQIVIDSYVNNAFHFNQNLLASPAAGGQAVNIVIAYKPTSLLVGVNGIAYDMSNRLTALGPLPPYSRLSIGYQGEVANWGGTIQSWEARGRQMTQAQVGELSK